MRLRHVFASVTLFLTIGIALWGVPRLFASLDIQVLSNTQHRLVALSQGWIWALCASWLLLVTEAMMPAIPLAPIVAANAALFGPWFGMTISWIGTLLGASTAFWIARALGRERIARYLREKHLGQFESVLRQHSFHLLLLGRFIPGLNSVISFVAGLGPASFRVFLLATAIGLLPWIALFTFFSHTLLTAKTYGIWLSVGLVCWMVLRIVARPRRSGKTVSEEPHVSDGS